MLVCMPAMALRKTSMKSSTVNDAQMQTDFKNRPFSERISGLNEMTGCLFCGLRLSNLKDGFSGKREPAHIQALRP